MSSSEDPTCSQMGSDNAESMNCQEFMEIWKSAHLFKNPRENPNSGNLIPDDTRTIISRKLEFEKARIYEDNEKPKNFGDLKAKEIENLEIQESKC